VLRSKPARHNLAVVFVGMWAQRDRGVSGSGHYLTHGKDERIRASDFYAGVEFYDQFVKALVGQ
jgi:hypothetical protein